MNDENVRNAAPGTEPLKAELPKAELLPASVAGHFAEAASAVLSQIAGSRMQAQIEEPQIEQPRIEDAQIEAALESEEAGGVATLLRVELSGALGGVCEIALSAATTAGFAALLMGETAEPESEVSDELREVAAELVQQICGKAADRLRAEFGPLELKAQLASPRASSPRTPSEAVSGTRHRLRLQRVEAVADQASPGQASAEQASAKQGSLNFELRIVHLAAAARPAQAEARRDTNSDAHSDTAARAPSYSGPSHSGQSHSGQSYSESGAGFAVEPAGEAGNAAPFHSRNLDLLLDIELAVTLRFGSRHMPLKEILELSSGSVVELDRRVEEPVDLLIDGRVIARGEVVIVEGNYGLRILQVANQGDKLACLP